MKLDDQVRDLVGNIWRSMLGLEVETMEGADPIPGQVISGFVHISGTFQGAVGLSCEAGFASEAATIMFGIPLDEVKATEMHDAIGELANMIGGNVKGLVPGSNHLSLPTVIDGASYAICIPGASLMRSIPLRSGGHLLQVSLFKSDRKAA